MGIRCTSYPAHACGVEGGRDRAGDLGSEDGGVGKVGRLPPDLDEGGTEGGGPDLEGDEGGGGGAVLAGLEGLPGGPEPGGAEPGGAEPEGPVPPEGGGGAGPLAPPLVAKVRPYLARSLKSSPNSCSRLCLLSLMRPTSSNILSTSLPSIFFISAAVALATALAWSPPATETACTTSP